MTSNDDLFGDIQRNLRSGDSNELFTYLNRLKEPNPTLGQRALRVTLDRPGIMRMQVQALIRGAKGRPIRILFPFIVIISPALIPLSIALSI